MHRHCNMQHTTAIEQPVWSDLQVQILNLLPSPPAKLRVSKTLIRAGPLIPSVSVVRPLNVKVSKCRLTCEGCRPSELPCDCPAVTASEVLDL